MSDVASSALQCPDHVLAQLAQRARQFYSLPAVVLRVLELTRNPAVDVRELRDCVSADPALISKLLRVVNSSLFGLSQPVADLSQAINLLGIQRLKMLVLGFSLPTQPSSVIEPAVLDRFWRHALVKSVAARDIANTLWKQGGDEAFVAGLLQDLGLLALVQELGEPYVKFLNGVWSVGDDPRTSQMENMGFDHVQLTARLLHEWGFPEHLVRAIAIERNPQRLVALNAKERVLPQVLDLAELLTRFLLDRQVRWLEKLLESGKTYLGLQVEQLEAIVSRIESEAPQLAAAMSVPWSDESDYVKLLREAHQRQAAAINEMAAEMLAPPRRPIELLAALNQSLAQGRPVTDGPSNPAAAREAASPANAISNSSRRNGRHTAPSPFEPAAFTGLIQRLNAEVVNCRQARMPIALLLLQVDDADFVIECGGVGGLAGLLRDISSLVKSCVDLSDQVVIEPVTASCLAVILAGADRQQASITARQVLDAIRSGAAKQTIEVHPVTVSMGLSSLSVPPRNFPAGELVQAAERCLNGARLSGGNGLKSIEIC